MTDSKIGVTTEADAEWRDLWTMLKDLSTPVEMTIYPYLSPNSFVFAKKLTSGNDDTSRLFIP